MTTVSDGDYQDFLKDKRDGEVRSHELAMRGTKVKIAKIEAKARIKEARARNSDFLVLKGVVAFFAVVAVLIVCITYWAIQPDPQEDEKIKIKQERYERCMQVEQDYDKCKFAGE